MTEEDKEEERIILKEAEILLRRSEGNHVVSGMARVQCDCGCGTEEHGVFQEHGSSNVKIFVGDVMMEVSVAQTVKLSLMLQAFTYAMTRAALEEVMEGKDNDPLFFTGMGGEA